MRNRLLFLCLSLFFLAASAISAQGEPSLILWIRGDLYSVTSFDAAPVALTQNGTISGPVLSPDERYIAYKAAAAVGMEALDRVDASGYIAEIDLPGDIYLIDRVDNAPLKIAGQPVDASLLVSGTLDNATIRSTPVWSPDGKYIAWTEYAYPDGQPALMIYNMATTATTALIAEIPAPPVQGASPALRWGSGGIAVNASTDTAGEQDYLLYDTSGALLSRPRLAAVPNDQVVDFTWVEGANQVGILYQSAGWILIDPATGVAQAAPTIPQITTAAAGSRTLRFGADPAEGFFWEVVGTNAAAAGSPAQVTLSPDGQQIAFIGFPSSGAVSIWSNDDTSAIPNTGSNLDELQVGALLWGYTYWTAISSQDQLKESNAKMRSRKDAKRIHASLRLSFSFAPLR